MLATRSGLVSNLLTKAAAKQSLCVSAAARKFLLSNVRHMSYGIQKPYSVPSSNWGQNRAARLELAASYRALNDLGLNEGVCNHLTCMAPLADPSKSGEVMLLIPYGHHWAEAQAGSLLGLDGDGKVLEGTGTPELSAACIHLGVRRSRPNTRVVMHTHQPYTTALACLKNPELLATHQNALRFMDRIAVDTEYTGTAEALEEGERLGAAMGDRSVLLMGNHGVLVAADTVPLAFDMLYYLEKAAKIQVLAQSTGQELSVVPSDVAKRTAATIRNFEQEYAEAFFYATYRLLQKSQPDFQH